MVQISLNEDLNEVFEKFMEELNKFYDNNPDFTTVNVELKGINNDQNENL
jgi:hypothetical protein